MLKNFTHFDSLILTTLTILTGLIFLTIALGDNLELNVVGFSPSHGLLDVPPQTAIGITFNEAISLSPNNSPLSFRPPLTGTLKQEGTRLIFEPESPLQSATGYTATLSSGLQSVRGRPLIGQNTWHFRTRMPRLLYIGPDDQTNQQLFAIDPINETTPNQLTDTPFGIWDYTPAPDGSIVAYAQLTEEGSSDLWAVTLDGKDRYQLLACPTAACNGVAWAPDSDRLIYERRNILEQGGIPGPPRLWWLARDTGDTLPVFDDNQLLGYGARWSFDGQWLSYIVPIKQELHIYNVQDGRSSIIPNRMGQPASWSPNQNQLLITDLQQVGEGFAIHLLLVDPDQDLVIDLSQTSTNSENGAMVEDDSPAWSPDGQWIAFTRKPPRASMGKQIWLMRVDGSEARHLTDTPELHFGWPGWHPDGSSLVFQRFHLREIGGKPTIGLINLETNFIQDLFSPANRPSWLP